MEIADSIRRLIHYLIAATLLLYAIVLCITVYVWVDARRTAARTVRTHAALCTLRDDLAARAASGSRLLDDHPAGIPGVTAAAIRASITNEERTVHALALIRCR